MVEIVILQCTVRDTLAQNCRMGIRLWSASYVQKHQQLNDKMNIYIYVYMYIYIYVYKWPYNHSRRWPYKTTAITYICSPPAATYMRPGAGLYFIVYAGTGM